MKMYRATTRSWGAYIEELEVEEMTKRTISYKRGRKLVKELKVSSYHRWFDNFDSAKERTIYFLMGLVAERTSDMRAAEANLDRLFSATSPGDTLDPEGKLGRELICHHCGNEWTQLGIRKPKSCPQCHYKYWDRKPNET